MEPTSTLDLRRALRAMRRGWALYAASVAVMMGLAIYYACNKQEQYKITGTVLIEDEKDSAAGMRMMGGMAQMMRSFNIGGFSSSVDNEWLVMASNDVRRRAVTELGLTRTYVEHTGWLTKRLRYADSPLAIDAAQQWFDTLPRAWKVNVRLHDGKADITSTRGRLASPHWQRADVTLPCDVPTPYGAVRLRTTEHYRAGQDVSMTINLAGTDEMAAWLYKVVEVQVTSKKGDAITLKMKDDRRRGTDIINALITAYNEKRAERRAERARAEVEFVDGRLAELQQELAESESRVTRFKQSAGVSNPALEAQGWLKQSTQAQAQATQAQAEITVYEMIVNTLTGTDPNAVLPVIEGMKDPAVAQYNELVARRAVLAQSATEGNAALDALDAQLKPLRESIVSSARKSVEAARTRLRATYDVAARSQGRYDQMPAAEQQYYDLLRDRELKNDLYVFLLEKKESALLKLGSRVTPSFILDTAYSSVKPDSTKALLVLAVALLMALLAPTALLLWRQRRRDLVEEPCDLPSAFEPHSAVVGDHTAWLNLLAAATARDDRQPLALLVTGPDGSHADEVAHHLTAVEPICDVVRPESVAEQPAVTAGATVFDLPQWRELPAYLSHCTAARARVLLVLAPRVTTRRQLGEVLATVAPEKCFIAFLPKNPL